MFLIHPVSPPAQAHRSLSACVRIFALKVRSSTHRWRMHVQGCRVCRALDPIKIYQHQNRLIKRCILRSSASCRYTQIKIKTFYYIKIIYIYIFDLDESSARCRYKSASRESSVTKDIHTSRFKWVESEHEECWDHVISELKCINPCHQ